MRDWGEATTVIGILQQITNEGGLVEFDNRQGKPRVRVVNMSRAGGVAKTYIAGMNEPEIVKAIWSAWEEVR